MNLRSPLLKKIQLHSSVAILNVATLFFATYVFQPFGLLKPVPRPVFAASLPKPASSIPKLPALKTSGRPVRIEIIEDFNGMRIDLTVASGRYDEATGTWTLDDTNAFFAEPSLLPNDTRGRTLIYGHNKPQVLGYLNSIRSGVGAYALVYTDNGKTFRYSYQDAVNVAPEDVSVFNEEVAPVLIVQTCSGSWFELRRMYRFNFESVTPS